MAHLVYHAGRWDKLSRAWVNSCTVEKFDVTPKAGDTFSDFTSHKVAKDQLPVGLVARPMREAMWGEKDYTIEEV